MAPLPSPSVSWACIPSHCQADGENLEAFYLLTAFATFTYGSQSLFPISDPPRGKIRLQPFSLNGLLSLSFWFPLRISPPYLASTHNLFSSFFQFSLHSDSPQTTHHLPSLTLRPLGSLISLSPHLLLPLSPSSAPTHAPPSSSTLLSA